MGACGAAPATLTAGKIPAFGEAVDAVWTLTPVFDAWTVDVDGSLIHFGAAGLTPLVVTDFPKSCEDASRELTAMAAASPALVEAVGEGGSVADACDQMSALANALSPRPTPRNSFTMGMSVAVPEAPPDVGSYTDFGDGLTGTIVQISADSGCATWEPSSCSFTGLPVGCDVEAWFSDAATLEVSKSNTRSVHGTFRSRLTDLDDVEAGRLTVDFDAEVCNVPALGTLVLF